MKKNYWLRSIGVFLCLLVSGSFYQLTAQVLTPRPNVSMTANSNGYYEYLPQGYNAANTNQKYPLILFIHGLGELGNGNSNLPSLEWAGLNALIKQNMFPASFTVNGQTFSFIIISPQFIGWPTPQDLNDVVDYSIQHYQVDVSRIYVTGLSMGGGATWDYAGGSSVYANRIAAIVPICGASWPENTRARRIAAANLPVWATHNDGDPTVPVSYTNDYITQINTAPPPTPLAKKTIFHNNSHDAWSTTYNPGFRENGLNIYEWMLQYQRNSSSGNQPPVVNAGLSQVITLPVNQVTLSGSGTAGNGTIISHTWSKVSGGNATITDPSNYTTTVTNLSAGTYVFRLTAIQNDNQARSTDVTITVNTAIVYKNIPGKIEAENWDAKSGPQYAVATTDAGGGQQVVGIINGSWMDYNISVAQSGTYTAKFRVATAQMYTQFQIKLGNNVAGTINIPNTGEWNSWATVSVSNLSLTAGNQTLRILSTNNENCNFNWMEFVLDGSEGNAPPIANAGQSQTISLPASLTLSGNGSAVNGETITSHVWSKLSGGNASISDPSNYTTTVTDLSAGTYVFRLTVSQDDNQTATSDVTVTVNPVVISNGKTIPGKIEAENWDAKSGPQFTIPTSDASGGQQVVGIVNGSWMDYNVNVTRAGTYTVNFRVATTQLHAQFEVKSGNTVLAIINIPSTGEWNNWATISVNNVALAAGNQILRILSTNTETCNLNWIEFVLEGRSQLPTANAGSPQNITLPISQITLTGTGTAGNGGTITYAWAKVSGPNSAPALSIVSPSAASTNVTGLVQGTYVFRLTVTQNDNQTATSDVMVTVNPVISNGKTIPGKIEAENWDAKSGPQFTIPASDASGGQQVVGLANGSWMDYNVNVTQAGTYTVSFRVATTKNNSQFQIKSGNTVLATINIPNTGEWNNWITVPVTNASLTAGAQTLRILSTNDENCNLNWIEFVLTAPNNMVTASRTVVQQDNEKKTLANSSSFMIFPNPVKDQFVLRINNNYAGIMKVQILDQTGKINKEIQYNKNKGSAQLSLSASGIPAGLYIIRLQMEGWSSSIKMIKL